MSINICTFNVKGLNDPSKRQQLFYWLKLNKYSVCLLQELHCQERTYDKWKKEWGGDLFLSGDSSNSIGVGILVNSDFTYTVQEYNNIINGRMQSLKLLIHEKEYIFLNIYAPNSLTENYNFLSKVEEFIISNDSESIIVGGDFNTVINIDIDKKNGNINNNKKNRDKINNILLNNDVNDIWRVLNPNTRHYTWHSNTKPTIFCRLDYFLVSSNLVNIIRNCKITTGFRSDHSLVYFDLIIDKQPRGSGYFKLNNSVILDQDYQNKIKQSIQEVAEINKDSNPNTLWQIIKGTIRNESIKYTSFKKKNTLKIELNLKNEIDTLEKELTDSPNNQTLIDNLSDKKNELNQIIETQTNGIILRAKAEWVEGAEKNTKYFSNLEKKRAESKTITRLVNKNNIEITSPDNILDETKQFYKTLYDKVDKSSHDNIEFFPENIDKKLDEPQKQSCEGILNIDECAIALKQMKNGKSPGSDGLTTEFFKIFWNTIKHFYINSINYSYENGNLTELQKQGVISLLPKKDKDLASLNNWRPISILNIDYKITSKAIANRIKKVLNIIINDCQTGFLKGRYIGENIRTIFEVIEHLNDENKPGLLFFADFAKAFDSIDHDFIFKVLTYFNFGSSFINWIKLFYKDAQSCVINNGYMSDFFKVRRGVRQGCPLSPYLFILSIEILYKSVHRDASIKGITIYDKEIKNTAFADDATFMMDGSRNTFENLINKIDNFGKISGLKLNTNKSIMLRSGSLKYSNNTFRTKKKFIWTSENASTLGITFSNNKQLYHELNLLPKIKEFCNCLNTWKKHHLSLIGKVMVIKTFALPKLIYPLTVLETPSAEIINMIKKYMFDFLWDNKPDKINRKTIIQSYENGGLKMIDINFFINSIKAGWVKRIVNDDNTGDWKHIYLKQLDRFGGKLIFECNISIKDLDNKKKIESRFLLDILQSWSCINYSDVVEDINKQILWNNSYIKNNNTTIFNKSLFMKGIKYIDQLFDNRLKLFHTFQFMKASYLLNTTDFLNYHTLVQSIPKQWKTKLKKDTVLINNTKNNLVKQIIKFKSPNKYLYNIQINRVSNNLVIKSHTKWDEEIDHVNWKNAHNIPFRTIINTKLRAFQYKYLMRIVPNNNFLYKINLNNTSLCDFCNMFVETNKHLFWECQLSRAFWSELEGFLRVKHIDIKLDYKTISLGYMDQSSFSTLLNCILIYAKYFIFKNKYEKTSPSFSHFKNYLKYQEKIERLIALAKDKLPEHENKWNQLQLL